MLGGLCVCVCMLSPCSHVQLFATPWTVAPQAPLSMGILQTSILGWIAMPSSRSSRLWDQTHVSYVPTLADWFFTTSTTWEAPCDLWGLINSSLARNQT